MAALRDMAESDEVHGFETEIQQVYWGLRGASAAHDRPFVTASEVADYLADVGRLAISRQKVLSLLDACGPAVKRKRLGGRRVYQLMRPGELAINSRLPGVTIIDPAKAFEEIRRFEAVLGALTGVVRICDPYLQNRSLDFLSEIGGAAEIRFLTFNLLDERKLRRDLIAFRRQFPVTLEIRTTIMNDNHDRFVLSDSTSFLMGGSLNGFAKKRSTLTPLSSAVRMSLMDVFDKEWRSANIFV